MRWLRSDSLLIILMSASIAMLGIGGALVSCAELEDMDDKLETTAIQRQDTIEEEHAVERKRKTELNDMHLSKLTSKYSKDELDLLGVSVHHLQHNFMKEVRKAGFTEQSKIYEIVDLNKLDENDIVREKGANITCPIDRRRGASYVHSIVFDEEENEKDEDHYGKATVMLSYTWGYSIGDVVTTLADYCNLYGLDPKRTYVWICCLCVNQHRFVERKVLGESVPFDTLEDIFGRRVKGIGHLLPMMNPWHGPTSLRRVWCLFEMITAKKYKRKITMIMPEHDRLDFLKMFDDRNKSPQDRMTRLFEVFSNTRVQDAKATEESDRANIMKIIESMPGSYTAFNVQVNELVRGWAIGIMKDEVTVRRELVTSGDLSQEDFVPFLMHVGNVLNDVGEKMDALQMQRESLSICESLYGKNHAATASTMNNVAVMMKNLGQRQEALQLHTEVLAIKDSLFGRDHAETADTMNNIASAMYSLGQKEEALEMYKEALAINESLFGKDHASTGRIMNNMALVMNNLGQKEEALEMYKEVLAIFESLFGKDHALTSGTMKNMALVISDLGQKEEALQLYKEVLAIYESLFGKVHTGTAHAMNDIALVMGDLGQKEEALEMYKEALAILESLFGRDHADTARIMYNMASAISLDQKEEALQIYKEVLAIHESLFGRDHAVTANTMYTVAGELYDLGQKEEALQLCKDVLAIYESLFGKENKDTAMTMYSTARVMSDLGQKEEALQLYKEVLAIHESLFGRDHADTANAMNDMALVMNDLDQKEEALQLCKDALAIYESLFGRDHEETANVMDSMALVMSDLGQKEEALQLYKEVHAIYESLFGIDHTDTADAMNNMAHVLYDLNRKEEALAIYESVLGPNHPTTIQVQSEIQIIG